MDMSPIAFDKTDAYIFNDLSVLYFEQKSLRDSAGISTHEKSEKGTSKA